MRGEFLVDFEGPPIADVPLLKRLPELESLLTANREHGAVAAGMQPDIALAVELEFMPAGEVTKPAALHLEITGAGPQRDDHRADVQVSHFQPPQHKGPSPHRRARRTTRITRLGIEAGHDAHRGGGRRRIPTALWTRLGSLHAALRRPGNYFPIGRTRAHMPGSGKRRMDRCKKFKRGRRANVFHEFRSAGRGRRRRGPGLDERAMRFRTEESRNSCGVVALMVLHGIDQPPRLPKLSVA